MVPIRSFGGSDSESSLQSLNDWFNQTHVLEILPEQKLRRLTEIAESIFEIKAAGITLLDDDNQWVRACEEINVDRTSREKSICQATVEQRDVLTIEDFENDPQFIDQPFPESLKIGSYAGIPILLDEQFAIGSFCLFHDKPRTFSKQELRILELLRDQSTALIDLAIQTDRSSRSTNLLQGTLNATADGILAVIDGEILEYNKQFVEIWEYSSRLLDRGDVKDRIEVAKERVVHSQEFEETLEKIFTENPDSRIDEIHFKDGRIIERFTRRLEVEGEGKGFVFSFRDITKQREAIKELEHRADYDDLTDLLTRSAFKQRLQDDLNRGFQSLTVLAINIRNFGRVNQSLGHETGDAILHQFARRMTDVIDVNLYACRLQGDKFLLGLLGVPSREQARLSAQQVKSTLESTFHEDEIKIKLRISMGISLYPQHAENLDDLFYRATLAMEKASSIEGDNIEFYLDTMTDDQLDLLSVEEDFQQALEREQFQIFYQPKISLPETTVTGAEALIRWFHPDHGYLHPGIVLTQARNTGLTAELDQWVYRQVARSLADGRFPDDFVCSVNISAPTFMRGDVFYEEIKQITREEGSTPGNLELEITEEDAMKNAEFTVNTLDKFRDYGFSLAVDDFGTGYSSLAYLSRFPLDTLKIDRSFILDLESEPSASRLIESMVDMAHGLNMQVVAEGVETEQQLELVKQHSVDQVQGFLFAKPMSREDFLKWLQNWE